MELTDPAGDVPPPDSVVRDDLLRLVFTCHPSLSLEAQVALSLRTLCGLNTAEVARALLVPEATMVKRLTRARQRIRQARMPYRIPADHELPDRLAGVAATVYLLFNEGDSATGGDLLTDARRPAHPYVVQAALAAGERDGPAAGLAEVERVEGLDGYPLWDAARGELLHRLGRPGAAAAAYRSALALGPNQAQRRHLEARLGEAAKAEVDLEVGDRVDDP